MRLVLGLGIGRQQRATGGAPAFSPSNLFALGENGVWLRPNNTSTVYQESTGSTAGAVNSPVGLLHDISRGTTPGSNLVSNPGPFSNTTGYTAQNAASISVVSSKLRIAGTGSAFPFATTSCATAIGTFYEFLTDATFVSDSNDTLFIEKADAATGSSNTVGSTQGPAGPRRVFFSATATTTFLRLITNNGFDTNDWDNIILRTVPGVPAQQATAGDRPTLREEGGSGVRFLENVSSDTLNWTAPAGTYTIAYVIPDGTVTILTGQALSGATNIMLASQIVEYIAVNRALTGSETTGLTSYLTGVANP